MLPELSLEQLEKEMDKLKAGIEKMGMKMVFWGHPFGVAENTVVVFDLGGKMDNYLKMAGYKTPYTGARTDFVAEH
jgi:hypothetical protein